MKRLTTPTLLVSLGLCSALAGCYTTRIHTGLQPQMPSITASERSHHTVVAGLAEISDPVDLDGACPAGSWASITEELTFINGLLGALTSSIYTPRTYTIMCTGGGAGPAPTDWGQPPPAAPPSP